MSTYINLKYIIVVYINFGYNTHGGDTMIVIKIAELLEKKGKTKYWLAKQTGISANAIGKIVDSKTSSIGYDVLGKICQALECNVGDIIVYEKENK